jgi:protein MpaA
MGLESTLGGKGLGERLLADVAKLDFPVLGTSAQGRPIFGARLAGARPGDVGERPPVVLMAGIHGDEPASVAAILDLWSRWGTLGPLPGPVWLVPALNPDGIAAGTKNSSRDIDLNRNFPARNFSRLHGPGYDPGPAPLSEPETETFAGLLHQTHPWGVVAVHAPFACINHDGPAATWAGVVSASCGWPVREDIGYPTPGSLGSWLGVDRGLPVLTIELPKGPLEDFRQAAFLALAAAITFSPPGGAEDVGRAA